MRFSRSFLSLKKPSLIFISALFFILIPCSFFFDTTIISWMEAIQYPALDALFGSIGTIEVIISLLFLLPTVYFMVSKNTKAIIYIWLGLIYASLTPFIFKLITLRERPSGSFNPWGDLSSSFPSLHTTVAFTGAFLVAHYIPRFKWLCYIYALLVGFTRIYFNFHYFSDIVTGSILGIGIGYFLISISKNKSV